MSSKLLVILIGLALSALAIYSLKPILTPFALGFLLAYLGTPGVSWLTHIGLGRTPSALLMLVVILLGLSIIFLLLIPIIQVQIGWITMHLPELIQWFQHKLVGLFPAYQHQWDIESIRSLLSEHWRGAAVATNQLIEWLAIGGSAFFTLLMTLFLTPLISFYLLRDWNKMLDNLKGLLPSSIKTTVCRLCGESDKIFSAFMRGQLTVMLSLATLYSVGLYLIGLKLALVIGILTGLLSFIPYAGWLIGLATATIALLLQFGLDWMQIFYLLILFIVVQFVESFFLTPKLIGNRLGLHPLAVIFSVIVGGQLFGFLGILLALPVASILLALLRVWRGNSLPKTSELST